MMIMCAGCKDVSKLPRGSTYQLKCRFCCKHTKGTWTLTEDFAGYREGFKRDVCAEGCGTILREEQLLG